MRRIYNTTLLLLIFPLIVANFALPEKVSAVSSCDSNTIKFEQGFYGQYYNMSEDDPDMIALYDGTPIPNEIVGGNNYWYAQEYFAFTKIENDLDFGSRFFPVNEGKRGDPYFFAIHWRGAMRVDTTKSYTFTMTSDDDSWLIIDGQVVLDINGIHPAKTQKGTVSLTAGLHEVEIYFAERGRNSSTFRFKPSQSINFIPLPPRCTLNDVPTTLGGTNNTNNTGNNNNSNNGNTGNANGRVLGATTVGYTPAVALYKTANNPDVYAIYENGWRHYISSPAAFSNYGYDFKNIKTVSLETLNRYQEARLLRTPENPTIYFLSSRPNKQWLKINIPSPTAFISYPQNYWGNVIIIDELDINSYPSATLVQAKNSSEVYLLENGKKRLFLNKEVLNSLGYSQSEILIISPEHLNSYSTGSDIG